VGPLTCSKGLNIYREEEMDGNLKKTKLRVEESACSFSLPKGSKREDRPRLLEV